VHDRGREQPAEREHGQADPGRQPQPVDALLDGRPPVPRAELPGHRGGGAVREEDRDAHQGGQRLAGHTEAPERHGADPPDDGRVAEQEERLGDQGAEGRHGQPQDLRVVWAPAEQRPQPAPGCRHGQVHGGKRNRDKTAPAI